MAAGETSAFLDSLVNEKKAINAKIILDQETIDALNYIEKNSKANISVLIEQGLVKLGVIKIAEKLKSELEK